MITSDFAHIFLLMQNDEYIHQKWNKLLHIYYFCVQIITNE